MIPNHTKKERKKQAKRVILNLPLLCEEMKVCPVLKESMSDMLSQSFYVQYTTGYHNKKSPRNPLIKTDLLRGFLMSHFSN